MTVWDKKFKIRAEFILSDFEKPQWMYLASEIPCTQSKGCYFHLCQSFKNQIQSYRLVSNYRYDETLYFNIANTSFDIFKPIRLSD